jgi:hypothetical protein
VGGGGVGVGVANGSGARADGGEAARVSGDPKNSEHAITPAKNGIRIDPLLLQEG